MEKGGRTDEAGARGGKGSGGAQGSGVKLQVQSKEGLALWGAREEPIFLSTPVAPELLCNSYANHVSEPPFSHLHNGAGDRVCADEM